MFWGLIIDGLLFRTPLTILTQLSNGRNSQSFAKASPIISEGKYIPLVKQTNWKTIYGTGN